MSAGAYLVFSQSALAPSLGHLVQSAAVHFDGALVTTAGEPDPETESVRLVYTARGHTAEFRIESRPSTPDDVRRARGAEREARGAGLADLAARCQVMWAVTPLREAPEWLVVEFCAVLASVALGPILPRDAPGLLGVRSARERSNALRGAEPLTR